METPHSRASHQYYRLTGLRRLAVQLVIVAGGALGLVRGISAAPFLRGDSNGDGILDLSDPVNTLEVLFVGHGQLLCDDAADANDDGAVDISDATNTLLFLFVGGEPPPSPGPAACGQDPTNDALSCVQHAACEPAEPFQIFLAPNGRDWNNGLTPQSAIITLSRAQEIIAAQPPIYDFEVLIAPGRYYGQTVEWTYTMPDHTITFRRLEDDGDRPVFDGCQRDGSCAGGTWFTLRHSGGEETNLHFWYIRVERYQTAIDFHGTRNVEETSNGSNRIYGCYFYNIGNDFNHALERSTAAVRLVNSDDNEIINSHFVHIVNHTDGRLLHAIYVAHMSSRNQILRNPSGQNTRTPFHRKGCSAGQWAPSGLLRRPSRADTGSHSNSGTRLVELQWTGRNSWRTSRARSIRNCF